MNIKTIQVDQFLTEDGKTFDERSEAIRHQVSLDIVSELERYCINHMDGSSERFKHSVCKHITAFEQMRATTENTKEATS